MLCEELESTLNETKNRATPEPIAIISAAAGMTFLPN
jgi:hypothetical protein